MTQKTRVLILCTGNSARSQMAEGLLRHTAAGRFEVFSAGTRPSRVRPEAIGVMQEVGIDISATGRSRSKSLQGRPSTTSSPSATTQGKFYHPLSAQTPGAREFIEFVLAHGKTARSETLVRE